MTPAPIILPKIGFRAHEAAAFIGVSASKFRALVDAGQMPEPRRIDGCVIWRGDELLAAFNVLTNTAPPDEEDPWGDVLDGNNAA